MIYATGLMVRGAAYTKIRSCTRGSAAAADGEDDADDSPSVLAGLCGSSLVDGLR